MLLCLVRAILLEFRLASLARRDSSRFPLAKSISSRPGLAKRDSGRRPLARRDSGKSLVTLCNGPIWRESGTHVEDRRVASIVSIGIENLADVAGGFVYIDLTALFRQT